MNNHSLYYTGRRFLVDTGAHVSVVPASRLDRRTEATKQQLQAANGASITTYGARNALLHFGNYRYAARLAIANVKQPLVGADFLRQHNLLVDIRGQRLIEADTYMSVSLDVTKANITQLACIDTNKYCKVHIEFPEILQPNLSCTTISHGVQHYDPATGPPVHANARRVSPDKLPIAKKEFVEMESMGIIRKSISTWASPLHIVLKPNGGWRPCGDYRRLNHVTTPDRYPIPHIQDLHAQLAVMNIFPKIDLVRGYHQIPVAPEDIPKTAIITPVGLYEYLRMPFG